MRCVFVLSAIALVAAAPALPAQTAASAAVTAAATITAADLARHVSVLTSDSMLRRDIPSRGLDMTAQYVAEQFQKLGLTSVRSNSLVQRYSLPPRLDLAQSRLLFTAGGTTAVVNFTAAAYLENQVLPTGSQPLEVLLVAGQHTSGSLDRVRRRNAIVLYVPPSGSVAKTGERLVDLKNSLVEGNQGLVVFSNEDSAAFARRLLDRRLSGSDREIMSAHWTIHVRADVVEGLAKVLAAAGLDLVQLRTATTPIIRELPAMAIAFLPYFDPLSQINGSGTPLVAGRLEGRDPHLAQRHLVILAHMDHVGVRRGGADSIANGANDNALGMAGLIALAQAFSKSGVPPRRSVIFVAVSGGLWSTYRLARSPSIASKAIAVLNLDMLSRPTGDTLAVAGLQEVDWPTPPVWIAAAHPELGVVLADGGTLFRPTSKHFSFVRRWTPALSFQSGYQSGYSGDPVAGDMPNQIDAERAARFLRFVFHVGFDLTAAEGQPRWTAGTRQLMLRGLLPTER